jgi:hypothetical protein
MAIEPGAFVKMTVDKDEPLREGMRIVRVGMNDTVCIVGEDERDEAKAQEECGENPVHLGGL